MYNPDEFQNDTNRANDNNLELGGNLVPESNANFEGEQGQNQQSPDDNSFHMDKRFDNFTKNDSFDQKEKAISDQIGKILQEKSGISMSSFPKHVFMLNKILLLITFTEYLFQRFDVVTLFFCMVIIFIEMEIFSRKHLYKWLFVLICSILLDAFVLIDVSPVS